MINFVDEEEDIKQFLKHEVGVKWALFFCGRK